MKFDKNCFIVVSSASGSGAPIYNGATVSGVFETLEEAKKRVAEVANEYGEQLGDDVREKWVAGYCEGGERKWADNYWDADNLTAWIGGATDSWERVEIFTQDDSGNWVAVRR